MIGEAIKQLDPALASQANEVILREAAAFRDILIHQYHRVRTELLWDHIQEDLPALKETVLVLLAKLDN